MSLRIVLKNSLKHLAVNARATTNTLPRVTGTTITQERCLCDRIIDFPDETPPIPEYLDRGEDEPLKQRRARLLYQSRKRGMTENCLLLSTFAAEHLETLSKEEIRQYDNLINKPTNDWELYYWMIGNKPTPPEYDNSVMDMLKEHASNKNRDVRLQQPALPDLKSC